MSKILIFLITLCFLAWPCLPTAIGSIDDFEDGDHNSAWFASNGEDWALAYLDSAGKYQEYDIYRVEVDNAHIPTHCRNYDDEDYNHYHFSKDYDDVGLVDEGDDFWDYMFQEGETGYPQRENSSHATTRLNCFPYALAEFIQNGWYTCWMDSAADVLDAFVKDADPIAKANVQSCDVLFYVDVTVVPPGILKEPQHATGVHDVNDSANKPDYFEWKYATSGVYTLERVTFETPKCDDISTTEGEAPGGNWDWDAGGDESDLYPPNTVQRAEP